MQELLDLFCSVVFGNDAIQRKHMKIISSNYFQGQPGTPGPKGGTGPPVSKSVHVMLCRIAKRPPKSPPLFMQGAGSGIEMTACCAKLTLRTHDIH